jgi:hypothetical protein
MQREIRTIQQELDQRHGPSEGNQSAS